MHRSYPLNRRAARVAAFVMAMAAVQSAWAQTGRYVRIELPGKNKILTLAEVEVFSSGKNVAQGAKASQSSVDHGGVPGGAVDGTTGGKYAGGKLTHTKTEKNPWWEVDLGQDQRIDSIVLWNRTDCCAQRLSN